MNKLASRRHQSVATSEAGQLLTRVKETPCSSSEHAVAGDATLPKAAPSPAREDAESKQASPQRSPEEAPDAPAAPWQDPEHGGGARALRRSNRQSSAGNKHEKSESRASRMAAHRKEKHGRENDHHGGHHGHGHHDDHHGGHHSGHHRHDDSDDDADEGTGLGSDRRGLLYETKENTVQRDINLLQKSLEARTGVSAASRMPERDPERFRFRASNPDIWCYEPHVVQRYPGLEAYIGRPAPNLMAVRPRRCRSAQLREDSPFAPLAHTSASLHLRHHRTRPAQPATAPTMQAIEREHASDQIFQVAGVGASSPYREWLYAARQGVGEGGRDADKMPQRLSPTAWRLEDFVNNERSKSAGLIECEVLALRLWSGPMHAVYNGLLHTSAGEKLSFGRSGFVSTMHCLASAITKLSRTQRSCIVYRALDLESVHEAFWTDKARRAATLHPYIPPS